VDTTPEIVKEQPSIARELNLLRVQLASQNQLLAASLREGQEQRKFWNAVVGKLGNTGNILIFAALIWLGKGIYKDMSAESKNNLASQITDVVVLPASAAIMGYLVSRLNKGQPASTIPYTPPVYVPDLAMRGRGAYDTPPSGAGLDDSARREAIQRLSYGLEYTPDFQEYKAPGTYL
jgi:hypothetical protein